MNSFKRLMENFLRLFFQFRGACSLTPGSLQKTWLEIVGPSPDFFINSSEIEEMTDPNIKNNVAKYHKVAVSVVCPKLALLTR